MISPNLLNNKNSNNLNKPFFKFNLKTPFSTLKYSSLLLVAKSLVKYLFLTIGINYRSIILIFFFRDIFKFLNFLKNQNYANKINLKKI